MTAAARIYLADLRELTLPDDVLESALLPEEIARLARFRREEDRRRHLVGRSLLRLLLGRELRVAPCDVDLEFSDQGKPFSHVGPSFNVSHSGDYVLAGLASGGRFGVDVEQHRPLADLDALVRRCFSIWETRRIARLESSEHTPAFFRIWARKEALLKALGGGLSIELRSVSIDHAPSEGNVLRALDLAGESVSGWDVRPIAVGEGAEAAVAWDRPGFEFELTRIGDGEFESVIRALAS